MSFLLKINPVKPRFRLLQIIVLFMIIFSCKKENNPPIIMDQIFSVKENSTPGLICATISASDPDGDILTYKLDEENVSFPFEIDPNNGNLKIKPTANLDYEETQQYKFRVKVKDATQSSSAFVTIQIIDQSEIPNVIDQSFDINENIEGVYSIGVVKFKSKGQNEEFNFSIVDGNTSNLFFIGEKSGELFLANEAKLNYENAKSHSIQIKVQNKSNTELYTIVTVGVNVADVNEKPAINNQSFSILENSVDNTEIGLVIASDVDAGQSLNYSIIQATISNAVKVDSSTGKLFVSDKSKFDFETNKQIILALKVTDNGTEALSDTANIIVNILDANENPVITTKKLQVDENSVIGKEVGKVLANSYEGAPIEYTIAAGDGTGKFTMNKNTGIISVAQSGVLNYETKNSYSLTIKVNEVAKPEFTTSAVLTIDLNDINEHPVLTDQQFTAYESQAVGAVLGRVSANDPDFGQSLIYSIVAGNPEGYFSIDPSNGNILLAKPVMMNGADELTFTLSAQVKDNGVPQLFSEANVTISVVKRAIPENGLIAYYPLNGDATDEKNRFSPGYITGAELASDRFGNPNSAYSFDGVDDNINLSSEVGNNIRSISLWFKLDVGINADNPKPYTLIAREGDYYNTSEFSLAFIPSEWGPTGKLRFFYSINVNDYYYVYSNNSSWVKGLWYHVVIVIDESAGMQMYINAVRQNNTGNYFWPTETSSLNTYLGSWGASSNRVFPGEIDDVIFYNRALIPDEVRLLYQ